MKNLYLNGEEFKIKDNKILLDKIPNNYSYTNDIVYIFQIMVEHCFDDYYLEKLYKKHILTLDNVEPLLNGCDEVLRYTQKVQMVIENCCQNPENELEYKILELCTIDINYLKYFNQLKELISNFQIINNMINKSTHFEISQNIFSYDFFTFFFFKDYFDLRIECNLNFLKAVTKNLNLVQDLDYSGYYIEDMGINERLLFFNNQNYKTFDDFIKYLNSLMII